MSATPNNQQDQQDEARNSTMDTAASRGTDERRGPVDPAQNPAPHSPAPDRETIEKGEDMLERIKPY